MAIDKLHEAQKGWTQEKNTQTFTYSSIDLNTLQNVLVNDL